MGNLDHRNGTRSLTVAIIGAGEVATEHARAFGALMPLVEIIGIADIQPDRAQVLADRCRASAFTDYRTLLERSPDIAVICLPHHLHRDAGIMAAAAGCHILMEKPLATTLDDARAILDASNDHGVLLTTGFVHRFRPEYQHAYQLISSGAVGRPKMMVEHFGLPGGRHVPDWVWEREQGGGGIVMYTGIHMLDRLRWFLQSEVQHVTARKVQYRKGIEVEEGLTATLVFENGCVATLIGNQPGYMVAPLTKETEVYGTRARLRIRAGEHLEYSAEEHSYQLQVTRGDHFGAQARQFVAAIRDQKTPWITGVDGLRALEITLAIYQSMESGHPVTMQETVNT